MLEETRKGGGGEKNATLSAVAQQRTLTVMCVCGGGEIRNKLQKAVVVG